MKFYLKFKFLENFSKNPQYQILWKFFQWEPSCSNRIDRQTWRL